MMHGTWMAWMAVAVMAVPFSAAAFGHTTIEIEEINMYPEREQAQSVESEDISVVVKEMPKDELTRDAVYMGSLTFAGLALFSSTILIRAFAVTRYDSRKQKIGAMIVIAGILFLTILHVKFAFGEFQPSTVVWVTVILSAAIVVGAGLVAPNSKEQSK